MASLALNGFSSESFYGPNRDVTDNRTSESQEFFGLKRSFINTMDEKYSREDERLKTFDHWPLSWLDKFQLAQTGMFFTGDVDKVKCYFCEVEIGRWEPEDEPVPEHLRWSPHCPLLRRRTTNNVPISSEALDRVLPPISYDICGSNDTPLNTESTINESSYQNTSNDVPPQVNDTTTAVPNSPSYFPEYPEYAIESARVRSFGEWPRVMKQKPHQLAEAGFFYTGSGDRVKCFSCGGGLKDWDDEDKPWEQHALWLSKCRFLKLMKGQLYVDSVIAKRRSDEEEKEQQTSGAASANNAFAEAPECEGASAVPVDDKPAVPLIGNDVVNSTEAACESEPPLAWRIMNKIDHHSSGSNEDVTSLSQISIPEEKLCKICYAGEYNTAFLPCGHVVACAKCASSVTKCPLCRKPFTDVMRVYFS